MGNVRSIAHKLVKAGVSVEVSSQPEEIERADKLILPGVGAFAAGMRQLRELDLVTVLDRCVAAGTPVLGICLGMQLLAERSEEGEATGLGWIDAQARRFDFVDAAQARPVPNLGWNTIQCQRSIPLLEGVSEGQRFYFAHSYHLDCSEPSDIVATASYGYEFPAVVNRGNVFGIQFHPEKSHRRGFEIVKRFAISA